MITYSIIIPIYNAKNYVDQAILSVVSQTITDWELILVNDGSIDSSLEICLKYQDLDSRIKVIDKKNSGVSEARNQGIKKSTGRYIVFLDADDWLTLDYLEKMNNILESDPVDLIICNYINSNGSGDNKARPISDELCKGIKENVNELIDFTLKLVEWKKPIWYGLMRPIWAKVFRRDIIENFQIEFDKNIKYGEDTAFLLEYLTYVSKIAYRNYYIYYYRDNPSSAMNNKKWNGPEPGEHYFEVVEKSVRNITNEEALASFWYNIAQNDWKVLYNANLSFYKKLLEMRSLLTRPCYIRFSDKKLTQSFSRTRKLEAWIIRKRNALLMMLIQYIKNARKSLKKVRETKTNDTKIYIHFYNECNFGDDAFVAMLANRYPNVTFFISGKREYLKAFEKVKNIVSYNDTNLKLFANKIIRKLTKKDPLFGCRAYRCQSCITIGGSIFIEPQSVDLSAYFRNKINKLFSGKNNLIIGANFGPYQNDSFLQFFRNEFHRYNYISVRDLDSYSLFQDIDNVNYAPDILFGIRNIVHSITVPVNARPYIVISVINKVDDLESYKHKLKEIVCYNHDLHFDVVMLSLCELQGDLSLCNEIVSGVDFDVKIHSYNGSNMQEVIHCIQSASYVIGSRFHAIITALAFQVPCFPIVYSNKTVNMLKDIGYSGRYGLIDELANLSMQEIDENRRKKYTPDVERLVKESEKHFLFLDKIGI